MSKLSEIKKPWLSLAQAAVRLSELEGDVSTRDDVLEAMISNRLAASVLIISEPLLVWPLVTLTGQDAAQFRLDEQRTDTYRGKSFTVNGEFLAPCRVDTVLQGGRVLSLPMSAQTRSFLSRLKNNPVPVGKRLCLPRGTPIEIPGTGQYFVTLDILDAPDVFCEIVVRTESLREFERQLEALNPSPPVAALKSKKKITVI